MRHMAERKRANSGKPGWICPVCGQWWTREPTSRCPGMPAYGSWDAAQAVGLRTVTQWKAERRNVPPDAMPSAVMMRGPAHPNDWYWLYAEDQTVPMRAKRAAPQKSKSQKSQNVQDGEAER
jgi:hypothetical protein